MAVCGRAHDGLGGDIAGSAGPVLDDEGLTKPLLQPLTYQTRKRVGLCRRRQSPQ